MPYRLHLAALRNDVETARSLLDAGMDVDSPDAHSRTPATVAARFGSLATLQLLVERGANLALRSRLGVTALRSAVEHGQAEALAVLLEAGSDPNETYPGDSEYTPLMKAVFLNTFEVTATLLSWGANVNQTGPGKFTALHKAAIHADRAILQLLLETGANINALDQDGDTPLLWAAWKGQSENALLLLERGADFRITNHRGETPLSYARESGALPLILRLEALCSTVS